MMMKYILITTIICLLICCKKESNIIAEPDPGFKSYFEIEAKPIKLSDGRIYDSSTKYELNNGTISKSYNIVNKQYYYSFLLYSSNISLDDGQVGTIINHNGDAYSGVMLNGLTLSSENIKDGIYTFELKKQSEFQLGQGTSHVEYRDAKSLDYRLIKIVEGTVTIKKSDLNIYEIKFNGTLEWGSDYKVSGYFNGYLNNRSTYSRLLSFESGGDYINYCYYFPLYKCYSRDLISSAGNSYIIELVSYLANYPTNAGTIYSNPKDYKNVDYVILKTRSIIDGEDKVKLTTGNYRIGSNYLYNNCYIHWGYNNSISTIDDGSLDVIINDGIIELDLNVKVADDYKHILHYKSH